MLSNVGDSSAKRRCDSALMSDTPCQRQPMPVLAVRVLLDPNVYFSVLLFYAEGLELGDVLDFPEVKLVVREEQVLKVSQFLRCRAVDRDFLVGLLEEVSELSSGEDTPATSPHRKSASIVVGFV